MPSQPELSSRTGDVPYAYLHPWIFCWGTRGTKLNPPDFQTPRASYYTSATAKNIYHTEQSGFLNVCTMSVK